jgi:hypothetical protein
MHARARLLIGALIASTAVATPATAQSWLARFSGLTETPPNNSPGTGFSILTLAGNFLRVEASFSGLTAPSTVAHIHCCTAAPGTGSAGVATPTPTFPGFPSGVTAGSYDQTFDLTLASSWNNGFVNSNGGIAGARAALIGGLNNQRAYFNVHSQAFTGGEINGFFVVMPEPQTYAMLGTGLLLLGIVSRRRRAHR